MREYPLQLDLQLFAQEKTEKATPRKKREARNKGQVAKSSELPGALIVFFYLSRAEYVWRTVRGSSLFLVYGHVQ